MMTSYRTGVCCVCTNIKPVMVRQSGCFCKDCTPYTGVDLDHLNRFISKLQKLKSKPKRENGMKSIHVLVNALYDDLKCVQVKFKQDHGQLSPKSYSYKTFLELETGDEVIVDSPRGGFVVVTVVGTCLDHLDEFPLKWVVQKVDKSGYIDARDKEDLMITKFHKASATTKKKKALAAIKEMLGYDNMTDVELLEELKDAPKDD